VIRPLCVSLLLGWAAAPQAAPLSIGIRGHLVQQEVFSLFALPGEKMQLQLEAYDTGKLRLHMQGQTFGVAGEQRWSLTAPSRPGLYPLRLEHLESGEHTSLNLFVGQTLEDGEEEINDYRIGPAPPSHSKYPAFYPPPQMYFEVTAENVDTRLSPNFSLRQFLCKQESDYPKYVTLKESLLVLLEGLITVVRQAGYPITTFGIISGYRTPYYNRRIGNVANSRHVYGDAMDFFVDEDNDGAMDDLNGDGEHNRADVDVLYKIVESFKKQPQNRLLVGGVGRYYKAAHHGGFVHVDARGFRARW